MDTLGKLVSDLKKVVHEHNQENSTVAVFPDVVLGSTDILEALSPLARKCFYSSQEIRQDIQEYMAKFDDYDDYMALFGASALKNYIELKELLTTAMYDFGYIKNNTLGAYHTGVFLQLLFNVEKPVEPKSRSMIPTPFVNIEHLEKAPQKDMKQYNKYYESFYKFTSGMGIVQGQSLDSCKFYTDNFVKSVHSGMSILKNATRTDKAEGVFLILDGLQTASGTAYYCPESVIEIVKGTKTVFASMKGQNIG